MFADYYAWGKLSIEKNKHDSWLWDLCLNGTPIKSGYNDPNQAADEAHKKDVGDEEINSILKRHYAPSDLRVWNQSPRKSFQNNHENN
jgi:hypothetical protein